MFYVKDYLRVIAIMLCVILVSNYVTATIPTALSDQGNGVRSKSSGALLDNGNLTIKIYDSPTAGNLIYSENFLNAINDGAWNVMLGENSSNPLYLELNRKYYKAYIINDESASFTNLTGGIVQRQFFYSPVGELGSGTNASGNYSVAMGADSVALGDYSVAIGHYMTASGMDSFAAGFGSGATGESSIAIATSSEASGKYSTVLGYDNMVSGELSTALGFHNTLTGKYSTAIGPFWNISGDSSVGISLGPVLFGEGADSSNFTKYTISNSSVLSIMGGNVGIGTTSPQYLLDVNGTASVNELCVAGVCKTSWPSGVTNGTGDYSVQLGLDNTASGNYSFAAGDGNIASGWWSTATGASNIANYSGSVAMGQHSVASGLDSIAMGSGSVASGDNSVALGDGNIARGWNTIAIGKSTTAFGWVATAMGYNTFASGMYSTATGYNTNASGTASTAMGVGTIASGYYSTAMGNSTHANSLNSLALGMYNIGGGSSLNMVLTDPIFEIGIGIDDSHRANAMTVLKNGNVGIGTTSPQQLLDVNGTVNAVNYSTNGNVGITQTITIAKNSTDSCDLIITGGLITGTTC